MNTEEVQKLEIFRQSYYPEFQRLYEDFIDNKISLETLLEYIEHNSICSAEDQEVCFGLQAGVGGAESKLFLEELKKQYLSVFALFNWRVKVLEDSPNTFKANLSAGYKYLRLENGVHRVQRVPQTEQKGRVHTSVVGVYAFPLKTTNQIKLSEKNIKIETFKASGPGGQHVNKTESAVRITHIPTGLQAVAQADRNQSLNKAAALQTLERKLIELETKALKNFEVEAISSALQNLDRVDKTRTYNWKANRITDHVTGLVSSALKLVFSDKKSFASFLKKNLLKYEESFFKKMKTLHGRGAPNV